MDSPEFWRWVWLAAAFVFTAGEMATAGSFFLLPFGIGAALACVLAFLGVDLGFEWLAFVLGSGASFAVLYPIGRRLDRDQPQDGIGAKRMIGEHGVVLQSIPGGPAELGLVRVGREEWRAQSVDGAAVPEGTTVRVVEVTGTRLVVWPVGSVAPAPEQQQ
jgi:membrane protein implicated in regulation of membrane protease activity